MDEYESLSHTTWDCKYHAIAGTALSPTDPMGRWIATSALAE